MNYEARIKSSDRSYRIISVLLPLLNLASVIAILYQRGNRQAKSLLTVSIFIICFDFIALYYLELHKYTILTSAVAAVLAIITPMLGMSALHFTGITLACPILLLTLIMTGAVVDITLGFLYAFGVYTYAAIFSIGDMRFLLRLLLIVCLTSLLARARNGLGLLASVAILSIFSAIIELISHSFVLESLYDYDFLIIFAESLLTMIISFLLYNSVTRRNSVTAQAYDGLENKASAQPVAGALSPAVSDSTAPVKETAGTGRNVSDSTPEADDTDMQAAAQAESMHSHEQELIAEQTEHILALEDINRDLKQQLLAASNSGTRSVAEISGPGYELCLKMRRDTPRLYKHCIQIAQLSADAAALIGCDPDEAYALGLYHEIPRLLGEEYRSVLLDSYRFPAHIVREIRLIKDKTNKLPVSREAGIVLISDDIINTLNYIHNTNNSNIPLERIVTNTFKVRKDQNCLRQAGFSNEEVQLLKLFYNDQGGNYVTSD